MRRIEYLNLISNLFEFKIIKDECDNEFVVFRSSTVNKVQNINDKTEFESLENHVHLLHNIKKDEFEVLQKLARNLGKALLNSLKMDYPQKHFRVYVSVHLYDSMIIRFHQIWDGENFYCNPDEFTSPKEKVYAFEN